jgi:hypothetical protein
MRRIMLLLSAIAVFVQIATPLPVDFPLNPRHLLNARSPAASAAGKLAKTAAMEWKKIGSIQFSNRDITGTLPSWEFISRDTVICDSLGDMIVTKRSSAMSGWWVPTDKDTVLYAQINTVARTAPRSAHAAPCGPAVRRTAASIRFAAPGITALRLFDLSGRLIVALAQKPGSSIELDNAALRSGAYIARIKMENGELVVKTPVVR